MEGGGKEEEERDAGTGRGEKRKAVGAADRLSQFQLDWKRLAGGTADSVVRSVLDSILEVPPLFLCFLLLRWDSPTSPSRKSTRVQTCTVIHLACPGNGEKSNNEKGACTITTVLSFTTYD